MPGSGVSPRHTIEPFSIPAATVSPERLNNTRPMSLLSLNGSIATRVIPLALVVSLIVPPRSVTLTMADVPLLRTLGLFLRVAPVARSRVETGIKVAGMF